jgi:hypothetical protein
MSNVDVNLWAVLAAGVINMVLGALWYSPVLFAKPWMQLIGKKPEDVQGSPTMYIYAFIAALVTAYVLAHIVDATDAATVSTGAVTGFWVWLGFVATSSFTENLFSGRPTKLWAINYSYHLVALLINGALIAVWR